MTESGDTLTNYSPSDCDNDDYPIDLFVIPPIHRQDHINDNFGLFNSDDDDDEDNLTLFDLKSTPKFDHDLSIFDELAHQCNAVLLSTNSQEKVSTNSNSHLSNLMTTTTTTTMINDYDRRFQRSIQKLTIPSWYNDPAPSPKISTKPSIIPTSHYSRESHRTPEIVDVHRPHSYRSCRSSLGTSPTPSVHSWHPNHIMDGMNFSPTLPSSSSSSSRRHNKYEKGIERVTKASQWYRPTQFVAKKENDQISTSKLSTIYREKIQSNHYDIPKYHYDNNDNLLNNIKENFFDDQKSHISRLSIQRQSNHVIDDITFNDIENTSNRMQNNNNDKGNIIMTHDKEQDDHSKSNEIQIMPLENEKLSFARVELEEVTDDEENDKRSSTNNIHLPSTVEEYNDDDETNTSLERLANSLVDSILTDVLLLKNLDPDDEDTNTGVRELSDDENGLRELDENDMSGTDEFILFATKAETSDDEDNENNPNNNDNNNQISPIINRGSLNRLYTFSRTNDDGIINNSKILPSNQDSSTSVLMIVDKDVSSTNINPNQSIDTMVDYDNQNSNNSLPIYRSHIQKRQINLGRYYDGMMRGQTSQLPTHDLRCNLNLTNNTTTSEGVTEETVRKGRILLDSIPDSNEIKNQLNENIPNQSLPIRSILKNSRSTKIDENKFDDHILTFEEKERISPRKVITTITEEYHRIQRKVIEEYDDGESNEKICQDSGYSSNQERVNIQQSLTPSVPINNQSPYELLSECYSGYSFIQNNFLTPIKVPLTSNVSSLQTTIDEAYESEVTLSPHSPTMSSSTTGTAYVHPDLEHEFEYPSPPPPVPDRRLKPPHLRPPPPPTKPRHHKQQQQQKKDSDGYSHIQKKPKTSPLTVIQHLAASTPNDSTASSTRTLSSRHYCGSLPASNEPITSSSSSNNKSDEISKQNSKKHPKSSINDNNNQQIIFKKSSSSSLNKTKTKRSSSTHFDEATNGLAIRLPASSSNGHDLANKQNLNRASTPSSTKRVSETTKTRPISENLNMDRSSVYETSV